MLRDAKQVKDTANKFADAFRSKYPDADDGPQVYGPKVQTYLKANSDIEGALAIDTPPAYNRGVRYAIVQGPSMVPADTSSEAISAAIDFNLSTLQLGAYQASFYNAQLLTLPELFLSGYEFGDAPGGTEIAAATAQFIANEGYAEQGGLISQIADATNMAIVCPMPLQTSDPAGNSGIFDAAVVFDRDGALLGRQFKTHLWGSQERAWFNIAYFPATTTPVTQGFGQPHDDSSPYAPFVINGFPVGVGICYDAEFPEVARCQALNGSLLTTFPTAAPDTLLPGQTEPYPDISQHYIPANALQNLNFCSYSNRAGEEYSVDQNGNLAGVLKYSGNSIVCTPYGKALVAPMTNEDTLLIADCIYCDYPPTQPDDTNYLINRRPELSGYLTNKTVSFPFGSQYTYPNNPPQHQDPAYPDKNQNSCEWTPDPSENQ